MINNIKEDLHEELNKKYCYLNMTLKELESFVERFCLADEGQAMKELMESRLNSKN